MAFSSLRKVIHRKPRLRWAQLRSSDRRASTGIRPRVELLEDRTLPSFAAPVNYVTGSRPTFILRGNFTPGSVPDLAVANAGTPSDTIAVLVGNANGTFQTPAKITSSGGKNPVFMAMGDFANNGKQDLIVANNGELLTNGTDPGNVKVLLGNGTGTFSPGPAFPTSDKSPDSVAVGKFTSSGNLDAVVAYAGDPLHFDLGSVGVYLGNGKGGFTKKTVLSPGAEPGGVAIGDFLGNGKMDIAVAFAGIPGLIAGGVGIYLGNGDGTFQPEKVLTAGSQPITVVTGVLTGSKKTDLVVMNAGSNNVTVFLNHSTTTSLSFTATSFPVGKAPIYAAISDFNADGKQDIAVTNQGANTVNVLLGNGAGGFVADPHGPYTVGNAPAGIVAGDFNGDHYPDLAVANSANGSTTVSVLLNIPQATHFTITPSTTTPKVGVPFSLTVTALDAFNNPVASYRGTVHFTSTVVGDTLPGMYTFTAADKGKHLFTLQATVHTMGARTITVTDGHIKGTTLVNAHTAADAAFELSAQDLDGFFALDAASGSPGPKRRRNG
jgi:FG-GAP-like repeat